MLRFSEDSGSVEASDGEWFEHAVAEDFEWHETRFGTFVLPTLTAGGCMAVKLLGQGEDFIF